MGVPAIMETMCCSSSFWSISWTWSCALVILVTYRLYTLIKPRSLNLPPGPKGLPIIGNLLMLGKLPHRDFQRLAKQYGPIMHLRLGFIPTVVVSSPEAAELFLKKHDLIFASRPFDEASKYFSYNQKGIASAACGPLWRNLRKLCTQELLCSLKIESFKSMREEEINLFVESLVEASRNQVEVDLSAKLRALTTDISFRMVLGKKNIQLDDQRGFHAILHEGDHLSSLFNMADYFPYVGALDLQGLAKKMKALSRVYDDMLEKIIQDHLNDKDGDSYTRDFVDIMLSHMDSKDKDFQIDRSSVKATLLEVLAASMDAPSTAVEWAFSELLRHPSVMKKVQDEIGGVVGLDRMVEESDLVNLEYLDMVIKESLRLHPVVPLLMPHESTEDCTINGYHIPQKCRIIINTWTIGRDSNVWNDAEKFIPERFIGKDIDYNGRNFKFLPFGSGRRVCPGINQGLAVTRLVLAQLVHCFDWELSNGMLCTEINMDEEFGIAMPRANHLSVVPKYRLANEDFTLAGNQKS